MGAPPLLTSPTALAPTERLDESPPADRRFRQALAAAGLGLGVTLLQILLACSLSGQIDPCRAYLQLFQWDSCWYAGIVENGYLSPPDLAEESYRNVAFFPGYPLTGWLVRTAAGWETDASRPLAPPSAGNPFVRTATGWRIEVSLLVAAQLACWGFWTYVFLLFQRWRVPTGLAVLGCFLILSRPAAFFLVAAYSEPLFLMSLLGFLYWTGAKSRAAPFLAALHGFVLTATRIAGLPIVVYPILHAWLNAPQDAGGFGRKAVRLLPALAVAAFAALGGGLFFLYCQLHFGAWDLYMQTQRVGWSVQPDYLAFVDGSAYPLALPPTAESYFNPQYFSRFFSMLLLPVFACLFLAELCLARKVGRTAWRERVGFYLAAWIVYYLSVAGTSLLGLTSMTRYVLGPEALLMLCLIHLLTRAGLQWGRLSLWLRFGLTAWMLFGLFWQIVCIVRFTRGLWVA